jgi:hypothetical protein
MRGPERRRVRLTYPAIDPLAPKNRPLEDELRLYAEIADGCPPSTGNGSSLTPCIDPLV